MGTSDIERSRLLFIFEQLDSDGDGLIDVNELTNALQLKLLPDAPKHAAVST